MHGNIAPVSVPELYAAPARRGSSPRRRGVATFLLAAVLLAACAGQGDTPAPNDRLGASDTGGQSETIFGGQGLLSGGTRTVCAVLADGVWCWGDGSFGQLGQDAFRPGTASFDGTGLT